jgi:PAS domain S-box-containing protein
MVFSLLNFSRSFSYPVSLNSYLFRLIIGALGPLLIFSVFMMILFARQEQDNRRRGLESTARALALAIDQEIKSSITNLEALATSEPLDVGAVNVFRAAAARILRTQNSWNSLTLFNPQGEPLMNIAKPLVEKSSAIGRASLENVLRTRLPVVSNFPGPDSRESGIHIHVPVTREKTIIYILTAALEPRVFTDILTRQKLPSDWRGTLFDSQYTIIGRTRDAKQFIGTPVGPLLRKTNMLANEQFLRGVTRDRVDAYAAISRLPLSGWFVALIVPSSEVNALLYGSLATVGGGGLVLLLIGLGVALIFAQRASRSIAELSAAAHDLGRGQSISFPVTSPIAELADLAREMERAAQLLRERENDRDRVEDALRQQEEYLQRQADLLNLANEAIFARRLDSRIIYWNRGAEQLYGYTQAEAIGSLSHELLATEFPLGWENFEASLLEAGEWSGELKQRTKDGRPIDVESRFKLIEDRPGGHVILECNRDVSQRKQSARRLSTEHAVTLVLAESDTTEAAWPRILEVIGEGLDWQAGSLWMVNKQSQRLECLQTWHRPAKEFTDCTERPELARGTGLPGRVWKDEEAVWIADVVKEAATLQFSFSRADNIHAAFAFPIILRNEVLGVIEFFSTTVRSPDDDVLKMAQAIGGEIGQFAERMRAEAALRRSEEHLRNQAKQLEQQLLASGRLVAVGELTASMAHEFNNPLGIILGFAQGLLDGMNTADPNYQHVRIIAEEAKRCERLVQELLEFGRPKSADFILTDIAEIIERTMSLVQPHAAKSKVETAIGIAGPLPRMHADPQQLQQILLNLSLNAVDAMPHGGTLTVAAAVDADESMIITVADTGIGIDADVLPKIFQPFFTSKKRRGLGLGLPICDRIVKSHGGTIYVESHPGQGTTFKIYLPLMPPAAATPAPTEVVGAIAAAQDS